jgi:hypothetical protein
MKLATRTHIFISNTHTDFTICWWGREAHGHRPLQRHLLLGRTRAQRRVGRTVGVGGCHARCHECRLLRLAATTACQFLGNRLLGPLGGLATALTINAATGRSDHSQRDLRAANRWLFTASV